MEKFITITELQELGIFGKADRATYLRKAKKFLNAKKMGLKYVVTETTLKNFIDKYNEQEK